MDETPNLQLPYIMAAQAQKHVTHNEAIRGLDAIVQLSVLDRDLTAPPASPVDGERYIVGSGATGAWAGTDGQIAAFQDGVWTFYPANEGWLCWIADEDSLVVWDGAAWAVTGSGGGGGGGSVNPTPLVGVNATADTTNRLSVSSPASLFNHEGAGHQQKINKNATGDTASQLYQTGFSGRAEIGLTGDDDFHFKVSPDGVTFKDSITIDKTTAAPTFATIKVRTDTDADNLMLLRSGLTGDYRNYFYWEDYTGAARWAIGRNSGNSLICFDNLNSNHRMQLNAGSHSYINSGGAGEVIINGFGEADTGTGGLHVRSGTASPSTLFRVTSAGQMVVNTASANSTLTVNGHYSPAIDGVSDLGLASFRFRDVRATNGTIQTSDRREKRDIADLEHGLDFLKDLRTVSYRWKDVDEPEVTETVTETVPAYEDVEVEIDEVAYDEALGKYVKRRRTRTERQPVYDEHRVFDQSGAPVLLLDGRQAMHRVQRMEERQVEQVVKHARTITHKRKHFGLIAQELLEVLEKRGVRTAEFAPYIHDQDSDTMGIRYSGLVPILIKAVQELSARLDGLEKREG